MIAYGWVLAKRWSLYRWLQKLTMHVFDRKKLNFNFFHFAIYRELPVGPATPLHCVLPHAKRPLLVSEHREIRFGFCCQNLGINIHMKNSEPLPCGSTCRPCSNLALCVHRIANWRWCQQPREINNNSATSHQKRNVVWRHNAPCDVTAQFDWCPKTGKKLCIIFHVEPKVPWV